MMKEKKSLITLKLNKEFKRLYYRGAYKVSPYLVVYCQKRRGNLVRIGITTGKKIGNAVKRNRSRRIIKEAFRRLLDEIPLKGYDFVFVARKGCDERKMQEIYRLMKKSVQSLIKEKG